MTNPILAPVVALVAWSLLMFVWLVIARIQGMKGANPAVLAKTGMRGVDLEGHVPDKAQWPSHNYNHLMEQPTIFYAIVFVLVLAGGGLGIDLYLAWGYVGLRILHSLVQCTTNNVQIRFPLWLLSSIALMVMTVRAGMMVM